MTDYAGTAVERIAMATLHAMWPMGVGVQYTAMFSVQNGWCVRTCPTCLSNGSKPVMEVVNGTSGPYLQADWDNTMKNNLADLAYC